MNFNFILIIAFFVIPTLSFAQNYSDLQYLIEHNIEESDTYVGRIGFKFHKTWDSGNCKTMIFCFYNKTWR